MTTTATRKPKTKQIPQTSMDAETLAYLQEIEQLRRRLDAVEKQLIINSVVWIPDDKRP